VLVGKLQPHTQRHAVPKPRGPPRPGTYLPLAVRLRPGGGRGGRRPGGIIRGRGSWQIAHGKQAPEGGGRLFLSRVVW
jgi:hypothetical protein